MNTPNQKTVLIQPIHKVKIQDQINTAVSEQNIQGWTLQNCIRMTAYDLPSHAEPVVWNQWEEYLLIFDKSPITTIINFLSEENKKQDIIINSEIIRVLKDHERPKSPNCSYCPEPAKIEFEWRQYRRNHCMREDCPGGLPSEGHTITKEY